MADFSEIRGKIWSFARRNHFAVQEIGIRPTGRMDFSIRLFRDDISVLISKGHGEPIALAAYPLCTCERHKRPSIQSSAEVAIEELHAILSQ